MAMIAMRNPPDPPLGRSAIAGGGGSGGCSADGWGGVSDGCSIKVSRRTYA